MGLTEGGDWIASEDMVLYIQTEQLHVSFVVTYGNYNTNKEYIEQFRVRNHFSRGYEMSEKEYAMFLLKVNGRVM